ncbi:DUF6500 family protein [Celerinatantimonas sp. MCCC 1A17872]|uniref:DUF6500 family protein n=1 Tax=Celerinatantimonas sp. MCCC 1A17872 TaxID=3177514 RepID=UPI0038CBFCD4
MARINAVLWLSHCTVLITSVSFYAFFANKNDDPELLMEAATWWIQTHRLDHFEKAKKIIELVKSDSQSIE